MDLIKGNSLTIDFVVYLDEAKTQVANIAGSTIKLFVKKRDSDLDAAAIINKAGTITDGVNGLGSVTITAAESNALAYNKLALEIIVKLANGTYIRTGVEDLNLFANVAKVLF